MGLQELYRAMDQGNYEDLFLGLEQLEGEERLEGELLAAGVILDFEGDLPRASAIVNQILAKANLANEIEIMARITRIHILSWEGNFDECWEELKHIQRLFKAITTKDEAKLRFFETQISGLSAALFHQTGKQFQALEKWFQALEIATTGPLLLKFIIPAWYNNLGLTYEALGDWDKALSSFERSVAFFQELGNEVYQAIPLGNVARYYAMRGDNDRALEYYHQTSEIARKYNWRRVLASSLHSIGSIYRSKGDSKQALEIFQQRLAICEEIGLVGWDATLAMPLYKIILLHLESQDLAKVQEYLIKLQDFCQINPDHQLIGTLSLLAEALFLKKRKRFREKSQAQDLLRELIENAQSAQSYKILAMLHLCDLLIQEAKTFGDQDLFQEAQLLSQQVIDLARTEKMTPLLIDSLILQSKFALIEGNAQKAYNLLEEAQELAEDKELAILAAKTSIHQDAVKTELTQWQELAQRNAPLQQRLEVADLEDYLQDAIRLREQTSTIRS